MKIFEDELSFGDEGVEDDGVKWEKFKFGLVSGTIYYMDEGHISVLAEIDVEQLADALRKVLGEMLKTDDIQIHGLVIDYS